jgi:hypothetical protein
MGTIFMLELDSALFLLHFLLLLLRRVFEEGVGKVAHSWPYANMLIFWRFGGNTYLGIWVFWVHTSPADAGLWFKLDWHL